MPMKWKNKGHEYDEYAARLLEGETIRCKYYIFGAGKRGIEVAEVLSTFSFDIAFIDNDRNKHGAMRDWTVIALEEYIARRDGRIIVAAYNKNAESIIEQLKIQGLRQGKDFWRYQDFLERVLPVILVYKFNKSYMDLAQITLTERCSLKCKKCAHACYAVDHTSEDLSIEKVKKSADSFFSKVDYCREFVLIGGEPLLYGQLAEAILYVGEKYRKQMRVFAITTNGTIIPSKEILDACKKYNVLFQISNYSRQVPRLKGAYEKLTKTLEENNVSYVIGDEENQWVDLGFEYLNREEIESELIRVFNMCKTPCREVRENRLYFCVMARSVSDNLKFDVGVDDFLDLGDLNGENYKKELMEFNMGYSEKGYLDMCKHCHGRDAYNYLIPAGEQVRKEEDL